VAYASPQAGASLDTSILREALAGALPDYMVPSAIVVLERLPLNPNGKVERKALPEPEFANIDRYEAPRGKVETAVADTWAEVLGIGQVGRNDDFFALGGHSLAILQVQKKLQQTLSIAVPLRVYFENPLLMDIAAVLQEKHSLASEEFSRLGGMSDLLDLLEN
jgi:hypothetical protein